ncbi:MAG: signal peptidase I [Candidatus Dojkabacteria bacterium]|nr:signal peptidase I [Candidatus Dojkabacteria bacterium]
MEGMLPDETIIKQESAAKRVARRFVRGVYDIVETLVIAGAIVIFVYLFVASPHEVIGRSMEDSFWNGEYLLADKISYHLNSPNRGDVVIFKQTETDDYIKRVIGGPGDTVEVRDGSVHVNGEPLDESEYLDAGVYTDPGAFLKEGQVYSVPEGKYFVMGDNRNHSSDSRSFGPIEEEQIKGRALFIYWPFSHMKLVPRPDYSE